MKWFKNLKIGTKLTLAFILIALIGAFTGYQGVVSLQEAKNLEDGLYLNNLVPVAASGYISTNFQRMRNDMLMMQHAKTPAEKQALVAKISSRREDINKAIETIDKSIVDDDARKAFNEYLAARKAWLPIVEKYVQLSLSNRNDEAFILFAGEGNKVRQETQDKLTALDEYFQRSSKNLDEKTDLNAETTIRNIIIFSTIGFIISVVFGFLIAGIISKPLNKGVEMMKELRRGHLDVRLHTDTKDEVGELTNTMNEFADELQKNVVGVMKKISEGNLNSDVNVTDTKDEISPALKQTITMLRNLVEETKMLTKTATEGKLSIRGNPSKFTGEYREIIVGINNTLDEIVTPLNEGNEVLFKMSKGDLTTRVHGNYQGDLNKMKQAINTVGESLSSTLKDVTVSIETTATASSEISASVEEMTSGLNEQSTQTSEVASAVEEMAKNITENFENARNASDTALKAKEFAQDGYKVVEETAVGMTRLAEIVRKSADTVHELGRSSNQIGEIVRVIEDIADQTNLLALNAAIEAARAGDQGRGFAVVADEVRKLSERTTKSTKEIATMIKKIQTETLGAVEAMEEGTKSVDISIEQTERARTSLNSIVDISQKVTDMITNIALSSNEQTKASDVISKNIDSISAVAQQSSIGNQQIARAMNDLNQQTDHLQKLISTFKLEENENGHSRKASHPLRHEPKAKTVVRENGTLAHNN